jgi:GntR family transcriptional regulator, transcriptional repressor for pyruvate dehydrogenase complex
MDLLEKFDTIRLESPVDKIINQLRKSIVTGQINPGDRLPSERQLSEKFGIGRTYVRDAIKKLEVFGILKTNPQSGTIVSGIDISAMEGLFTNVIKMGENDFAQLVETRVLMESFAARQAAIRRSSADILMLEEALDQYKTKVEANLSAVNEDFNFHLKIADASQNSVIKSLMLIIIPDIIFIYRKLNVCGDGRFQKSLGEHAEILNSIVRQKPDEAEAAMRKHLQDVVEFSLSFKSQS